jgi:putative inorganic carbon (hco3(-)) transporter
VTARLQGAALAAAAGALAAALGWAVALQPALAVAACVAAGVAFLVVLRPDTLLLLLVAALPWEGALAYPSATLSVVKLLGALLLAAWLWQVAAGTQRVVLTGSLVPVGLFACSIGIALAASPDAGEGMVKTLRYALYIVFFFLVTQMVDDRAQVRRIVRVFVLSAAAAAAWALYAFLIAGTTPRAAGPITDPNDFGYLQACVLPLSVYLLALEPRRRVLWGLCFALMAGAILASLSRGALVGLGGLLIWALATRRIPLGGILLAGGTVLAVGALALVIWSPLINDRLQSHDKIAQQNVNSRIAFWSAAVRMWEDHPVVGVGVDRYGIEAPSYVRNSQIILDRPAAHDSYLQILAEQGALGLLTFLGFLLSTWALLLRAHRLALARDDRDGRLLSAAMQGTFVVAVVSATFISAELSMPFWIIGGLAAAVETAQTRARGAAAVA